MGKLNIHKLVKGTMMNSNTLLRNVKVLFSRKQNNESPFLILGFIKEPEDIKTLGEKGYKPYCFAHIRWAYDDYIRRDGLQPPAPRAGELWLCDIMSLEQNESKRLVAMPVLMLDYDYK
jgi:hypothetical protein